MQQCENFARDHPELVAAVMTSAASDWAAMTVAHALRDVAAALVIDDERMPENGGIVRPRPPLLRP